MKQAIIVRTDLKMEKGKIAAQASHASLAAFEKSGENDREAWKAEGQKKVVLKVSSKKELYDIYKKAKQEKLPCELIVDRGLTQLKKPEATAVGIGPAQDMKIDKITGRLKLL